MRKGRRQGSVRAARRCALLLATLFVAVLAAPDADAAAPGFSVAAEPAWVTPVPTPEGHADGQSEGVRTLLFDHQVLVGRRGATRFKRFVRRITNESGLQSVSQIDLEFDPSYQALTFHHVVVRRGDQVFDRLDRGAVRLVQREKNLDAQLYDGRLTAVLFLPDLRIGDVVECSFSIAESDPTAGGRHSDALGLGWTSPVDRVFVRVVAPRERALSFVLEGNGRDEVAAARVRAIGDNEETVWDRADVPAYPAEPDAPPWFDPIPWVAVTEFASWREVSDLGQRLFDGRAPKAGPLKAWIDKTREEAASDEDFILKAARFVQDEVRYVAVEVGMARRRPNDPAAVFQQRYGDCKDKTALLVAILRAGHVNAHPALVNSSHGQALDQFAPTVDAFDHAIVRAVSPSGDALWIDPTVTLQGGGVDRLRYSPFARALELGPGGDHLEHLKNEPVDDASPQVHDVFRVASPVDGGDKAETALDSERVYHGYLADFMRATIRGLTKEQLRTMARQYYTDDYPTLRDTGDVEVKDDRARNELHLVSHFGIPGFWAAGTTAPYEALISAHMVRMFLARPSAPDRKSPLGLTWPLHVRYEAEAILPFVMGGEPSSQHEDNDAFRLWVADNPSQRRWTLAYDLVVRQREVAVDALKEYTEAVDRMRGLLPHTLTYRPVPPDGPNWPVIALLATVVPLAAWAARRLYLYNPEPPRREEPDLRLSGIRGWLLLLAVNVVTLPLRTSHDVYNLVTPVVSRARWAALGAGTRYSPYLGSLIVGEAIVGIAITAYTIALAATLLKRRRSFAMHFTNAVIALVVFRIADLALASMMSPPGDKAAGDAAAPVAAGMLSAMIWTFYVHGSRRVKATFLA